jgi:hypothetical protein
VAVDDRGALSPGAPSGDAPRVLAIDWSGARHGAQRRIWLAEWNAQRGGIVRLEQGRTREALVEHLCREVQRDPHLVIGLDFAFSFPAWFLAERRIADAPAAWALAARHGEEWLAHCPPPFWGRPGRPRPALPEHFRRTERELVPVAGIRPKSVLQVGGAGAVGTGSVRGMPFLTVLRQAGCAIWPFDAPSFPLVVEIYPRLLTRPVKKSRGDARAAWLDERLSGAWASSADQVDPAIRTAAAGSEDAFDALASALAMGGAAHEWGELPDAVDATSRLEGEIWRPRRLPAAPATPLARGAGVPHRAAGDNERP